MQKPRSLLILCLCSFLMGMTLQIITPLFNLIISDFKVDMASMATVMAVFYATIAIVQPVAGMISDKIGRKGVLSTGLFIFVIGSIGAGLSWDINSLIRLRAVQAIGAATIFPMGQALIGDIYPSISRGGAMGIFISTTAIAAIIGTVTGGLIGENYGWRVTFYILAVVGAVCLISVTLFFSEPDKPTNRRRIGISDMIKSVTERTVFRICLIALMYFFVQDFLSTYGPSYFQSRGVGVAESGYLMIPPLTASIIGMIVGGRLSDSMGRKTILSAGMSLSAIGVLLLPFTPSLGTLIAVLIILGFGLGVVPPILPTIITEASDLKGTTLGVYNITRWMGGAAGVQAFGYIIAGDFGGYKIAFLISAGVITLLSLALFAKW